MRVISGRCKGKVLYSPKNNSIRPTSDKIKKFIFDYIGNTIEDTVILDIFSGTGNLSIEALSRGAQFAVLVDNSKDAIQLIYRNLKLTKLLSQSQIIKQDALRYLKKAVQQEKKFNFIFADPPYFIKNFQNIMEYIGSNNILENGGFFILEHSSQTKVNAHHSILLSLEKTTSFGDTAITFYRKKESKFAHRNISRNI